MIETRIEKRSRQMIEGFEDEEEDFDYDRVRGELTIAEHLIFLLFLVNLGEPASHFSKSVDCLRNPC